MPVLWMCVCTCVCMCTCLNLHKHIHTYIDMYLHNENYEIQRVHKFKKLCFVFCYFPCFFILIIGKHNK